MADFISAMQQRQAAKESKSRQEAARTANLPGVTGEMTDVPDTLRMKLSGMIAEGLMKLGMSGRGAYDLGGRTTTVAEAGTPLGMVTGMEDLARAENPQEAQLAAMGLIPGVGKEAKAAGNLGRETLAGIRAYHGSPHSFAPEEGAPLGRFKDTAIGTGEGAQAYGRGHYLAESEGVARDYRNKLADRPKVLVGGQEVTPQTGLGIFNKTDADNTVAARLSSWAKAQGVTGGGQASAADAVAKVRADLDQGMRRAQENGNFDLWSNLNDQSLSLKRFEEQGLDLKHGGHMYEVNINADPEHFLDWDKPLAEQSEATRLAAAKAMKMPLPKTGAPTFEAGIEPSPTGEQFHTQLGDQMYGGKGDVATRLKEAGIPGIKYLDQGSRGKLLLDGQPIPGNDYVAQAAADVMGTYGSKAAAIEALGKHPGYRNTNKDAAELLRSDRLTEAPGTRNYVVFDPKIIDIVRKYGIAGALGAGLISQEMASQMQEQGLGGT